MCPGVSVVSRWYFDGVSVVPWWCLGDVWWFFGGVSVVSRLWLGGAVSFVELLCFSTQDMIRPALSIHERHGLSQEEFDCLRHI